MAGSKTVIAIFRPIVWLAVMVLYLLVGGGIFYATEAQREEEYYEDRLLPAGENITEVKMNLSQKFNLSGEALDEIFSKMLNSGPMSEGLSVAPGWSFLTSCAYAMTVLTTTGYGALIPSTILGKVLTAFYAFGGIPIFITYVCVMGGVINYVNHAIALKIFTANRPGLVSFFKILVSILLMAGFLFGSAAFHMMGTDWDFKTSLYFSVITFTTIGFGDYYYDVSALDHRCPKVLLICHMVMVFAGFAILGGVVRAVWDDVTACKKKRTNGGKNYAPANKKQKHAEPNDYVA